jgi:integrase
MTRALNRAGLPHFRMHDLRHYAASILHAIGIPDQYIMDRGGWRTDNVMKNVYRDALDDVSVRMNRKVVNYFGKL